MLTETLPSVAMAALIFATIFIAGGNMHPLRIFVRDERAAVSFGAGMSMAYVFVHVMPELNDARLSIKEVFAAPLPFEGAVIYFVALLGFLGFYGLDNFRTSLKSFGASRSEALAYRAHLSGFAAYVALAGYLLSSGTGEGARSIWLYVIAISLHFLAVDHSLRKEYGEAYERVGRFVLAVMCIFGAMAGAMRALPGYVTAFGLSFMSGAIIMNSAVMELPSEKDGRFSWFAVGGIAYGLILLPMG